MRHKVKHNYHNCHLIMKRIYMVENSLSKKNDTLSQSVTKEGGPHGLEHPPLHLIFFIKDKMLYTKFS
jgi:hypothetical protein